MVSGGGGKTPSGPSDRPAALRGLADERSRRLGALWVVAGRGFFGCGAGGLGAQAPRLSAWPCATQASTDRIE